MGASRSVITMSDVADELGLSRVTVSAVLNNRYRKVGISDETAGRVVETARRMGYYRNDLAMAMKNGRNMVIGTIVSKLSAVWVGMILSGILKGSRESQYLIKVEEVSGTQEELAAFSRLMGQRVAGIICCNFNPGLEFIRTLSETSGDYNLSIVSTSSDPRIAGWHVESDDYRGSFLAMEYLWSLGHRRIAYLDGYPQLEAVHIRRKGFIDAFKTLSGGKTPDVIHTPNEGEDIEPQARELLSRHKKDRPTALLCMNEFLASQAIRVANSLRISVPGELSITAYSGSTLPLYTDPQITTVEQPFHEIGKQSFERLLKAIKTGEKLPANPQDADPVLLPLDLVERGSTASPGGITTS